MKKVSLLILLVIVASTLMAAIPTPMVRLTMINKSGYDVYMKLEGSAITEAFYYLTVPAGTRDLPVVKVFTIMQDWYTRTTWLCGGLQSGGNLMVDGNLRLTFIPCGEFTCRWSVYRNYPNRCTNRYPLTTFFKNYHFSNYAGEPRYEKVSYWRYVTLYTPWNRGLIVGNNPRGFASEYFWEIAYLYAGLVNAGCQLWGVRFRTYRLPYGCAWRYQY